MLNEQLQKKIEQEAEHYANVQIGDKAKFIGHHDSRRWDDAKEDWEAGAEHYAALWQAAEVRINELHVELEKYSLLINSKIKELNTAEEKAAKYEKALKDIANPMAYLQRKAEEEGSVLNGMAFQVANDPAFIKSIAIEALTPKTGEE